jgi:hypothetical protein
MASSSPTTSESDYMRIFGEFGVEPSQYAPAKIDFSQYPFCRETPDVFDGKQPGLAHLDAGLSSFMAGMPSFPI